MDLGEMVGVDKGMAGQARHDKPGRACHGKEAEWMDLSGVIGVDEGMVGQVYLPLCNR